ncbi:MAG: ATP-binding protein [Rickettsiaceae bacterium]|nr:ATP-binding protein [Rickettsiaceae bacterium]
MLKRSDYIDAIESAFLVNPVCALLGPRQCGKTTLSKQYSAQMEMRVHFFDLEDPTHLSKLANPKFALQNLDGLIVIDEVQRVPELFQYLRVFVDEKPGRQILILGSASSELIKQSSETLAGRISYIEMNPFSLKEVGDINKLWQRGGFPKSFLAQSDKVSNEWRKNYIRTFLEKDIRNLGFDISAQTMRRFWYMLAHYHGQIFNASEIGRSIDASHKTTDRYLDILTGTFMIRRLSPWFENISKRQVKSPKIFFRDSGLLHTILGIDNLSALRMNPKLGPSWEGFALEEVVRVLKVDVEDCYFWASQSGAELDLLVLKDSKKLAFEIKYTDSPKITKSMRVAMEDLSLDSLTIIIPGRDKFRLDEKIDVCGLEEYISLTF